jgi:hypothetical protein
VERPRLPAGLADTRSRATVGLGAEVFVRRGTLTLRAISPVPALYRGLALHPDDENDPYVFRIDLSEYGIGSARIVFGRDPRSGPLQVHLDVLPLSLQKQPAAKNPRLWVTGALGALTVVTAATAVRQRRARAGRNQRD